MTNLDRRSFLGGLGLAGVCAFSDRDRERLDRIKAEHDGNVEPENLDWHKAPCRYCGTGCGVEVGIQDGKAVAVRGDEKSPVNKGLLCVKGYHLPAMLYGEDRLLHPQLRQSDGSFKRISWDDALDLIASMYQETLEKHGPDAIAVYGSGQWGIHDGYAALKWTKGGMRTNNIDPNARLCMASAVMGFITQFKSDEPMGCYDDFEAGNDFVFWGNNMAEMHPVLFSRILENKRKNPGVRIIDLATRRTPTSDYADMTLIFTPGTDLALANGILHLLIANDKIDHNFIAENIVFKRGIEDLKEIGYGCYGDDAERYTFKDKGRDSSLEEMTEFLKDYTPEKVAAICGISKRHVELLAEMYGDIKRNTVSLWCMGMNQHTRGTWINNLVNNIHLITGKISRPGNNPFSLTGQPSACGTAREVGTLSNRLPADMVVMNKSHREKAEKIWGLPPETIPPKPGYHAVDMFRALTRGDVKTIWIQVTNPWVTMPNLNRMKRKPGDGKFIIVSDIYPTPTTDNADLILPSAAWIEREGCFGNSERRTQHWNQLIDPPGEAKEDAWQIMQVAKRMGMGHLFPWMDDADWHEKMFEEYRSFGLGTGKDLASYEQLKATRGLRWPVKDGKETRYRYAAGFDPFVKKKKGVHFYKAKAYGEKAAIWLRPYHPPAEVPDDDYPFWLCTGRVLEHWHTGSMTRRVKQLHQARPNAYVEINRSDATRLGINAGDKVRLISRRGQIELPAHIDERGQSPQGLVFVPFFDETKLINLVTLDAMDNISKEPDYKKCAVRLERV
jgi:nitrate reductase (cytochrome)